MRHGSLFSGMGGFDLAAEWMGWENVFHCEWNSFGQQILKYYWPNAISYEDITKTDFSIHRGTIDIITGGFPCQPFSQAGKRKGKEDHRYLWPQMLRAIDESRPTWVCGENVAGIASMVQPEVEEVGMESQASLLEEGDEKIIQELQEYVIETICNDLERIGYSVQPLIIPACATGAPHRRDRIWFVAYSHHARANNALRANTDRKAVNSGWGEQPQFESWKNGGHGNVAYANSWGLEGRRDTGVYPEKENAQLERFGASQFITNSNGFGLRGQSNWFGESRFFNEACPANNWTNFPTQSPVCDGNDGFPSQLGGITFSKWRNESIKAGGNAIVPQVAYQVFKAIEAYNAL